MATTWNDIRVMCQRRQDEALRAPDPLGRLIAEWPHLPAPDPADRVTRDGSTLAVLDEQQYRAKVALNRAVLSART
jgi:hypothetical protein